jgi:hypothetical protein
MDCSEGIIKLKNGHWYDATTTTDFDNTTPVYACMNPLACSMTNSTELVCAAHATGPLCAVCEEGYVPDAAAVDGRCKKCESSIMERWGGKSALLGMCALIFFVIGLFVISRPAPKLKIDSFLTKVNVQRIVRHFHKNILYRMVERDHSIADNGVTDDVRAQCVKLLDRNKLEAAAEVRRTVLATHSAGLAAASVGASTGASGGAAATKVEDAARHAIEQALHTGEEHVTAALETMLDAPDIDGSLRSDGVRRNSLVLDSIGDGARAIIGDGSSTKSCFTNVVAQVRSAGATLASLLITSGQLKLVLGNLQINASLTVVFDIPWPPVHIRFINFLSVFKLDLFKGLSFMAPCLHSSHFMSLASFVAAVRTLLCISNVIIIYRHVLTSPSSPLPPAAAHHSRRFRSRLHHPLRCAHCAQEALSQRTTCCAQASVLPFSFHVRVCHRGNNQARDRRHPFPLPHDLL